LVPKEHKELKVHKVDKVLKEPLVHKGQLVPKVHKEVKELKELKVFKELKEHKGI
jgi:hypothetical protein